MLKESSDAGNWFRWQVHILLHCPCSRGSILWQSVDRRIRSGKPTQTPLGNLPVNLPLCPEFAPILRNVTASIPLLPGSSLNTNTTITSCAQGVTKAYPILFFFYNQNDGPRVVSTIRITEFSLICE